MVIYVSTIRVSAKDIVELLYGSGDLSGNLATLERARQGTEIHQYWQSSYPESSEKEVFVKTLLSDDSFDLEITGRIDGIHIQEDGIHLEEIKSTYVDFEYIDEKTYPEHFVQAKLYAYLYCLEKSLRKIIVEVTYINIDTKEHMTLPKTYTFKALTTFFEKTIEKYKEWLARLDKHEKSRLKSIEGLTFPFPEYRSNQRELMGHIYRNILESDILYATAPTGIGKTIASIFSSLKAISRPRQKLFYLTAKNDGKKVVLDTVSLLEENGLIAKTCEITAKDSMCLLKEKDCDPEHCKYAKGYYKKLYKALSDILENESIMSQNTFRHYGKKHVVCPFELSLDTSNYSDIVLCDYNYVFDPRVHLIRYFEDTTYEPIILVDEAHNLVSRSRDMYSATLKKSTFLALNEVGKYLKPSPKREITKILNWYDDMDLELIDVDFYMKQETPEFLIQIVRKCLTKLDQILSSDKKIPMRNAVMDLYFELFQFVKISEFYNHQFVTLFERVEGDLMVSIKCLDASEFLLSTIENYTLSTVFFSATLEPIFYYKTLLTKGKGKDIKMISSFKQDHLYLLVDDSVSTRYNDRSNSIEKIIEVTKTLVESKKGNYIVFFPSYQYLKTVYESIQLDSDKYEIILQKREMSMQDRKETLLMFGTSSEKTQIGFFVMGGVFGESIDLIGDMLSGVIIVGVGLPGLSPFNNILKSHYDEAFQSGFDFAYTYPGLNKVIQAVGRVIRSETDRGIAILLDDRFTSRKYLNLYPREWSHLEIETDSNKLKKKLDRFWKRGSDEKNSA